MAELLLLLLMSLGIPRCDESEEWDGEAKSKLLSCPRQSPWTLPNVSREGWRAFPSQDRSGRRAGLACRRCFSVIVVRFLRRSWCSQNTIHHDQTEWPSTPFSSMNGWPGGGLTGTSKVLPGHGQSPPVCGCVLLGLNLTAFRSAQILDIPSSHDMSLLLS